MKDRFCEAGDMKWGIYRVTARLIGTVRRDTSEYARGRGRVADDE